MTAAKEDLSIWRCDRPSHPTDVLPDEARRSLKARLLAYSRHQRRVTADPTKGLS